MNAGILASFMGKLAITTSFRLSQHFAMPPVQNRIAILHGRGFRLPAHSYAMSPADRFRIASRFFTVAAFAVCSHKNSRAHSCKHDVSGCFYVSAWLIATRLLDDLDYTA